MADILKLSSYSARNRSDRSNPREVDEADGALVFHDGSCASAEALAAFHLIGGLLARLATVENSLPLGKAEVLALMRRCSINARTADDHDASDLLNDLAEQIDRSVPRTGS